MVSVIKVYESSSINVNIKIVGQLISIYVVATVIEVKVNGNAEINQKITLALTLIGCVGWYGNWFNSLKERVGH